MSSYATVTPGNMELTPCRVSFKGPGALTFADLGGTLGNVSVKMKYDKAEIKADQFGTTVLDRRVKGVMVTIETELAELELKALWKIVFPHATLIGTEPATYVDFLSQVGDGDISHAGELLLHPLSRPDSDLNHDLYAWKVCAMADSEVVFGPDKQQSLKIVWNVLLDTSVTPARMIRFGDKAL